MHMPAEEIIVETCLRCEGILHIAEEVNGNESAAVIRAKRYLAARVG